MPLGTPWPSLQEHGRSTEARTSSQVTTHIAKAVRVPPNRFHIFPAHLLLVDRMWHNPNRIHAVPGPIVTLTAVRLRQP